MSKRKCYWALAALSSFCLCGIVFFLNSKTETQESIKVYKVVTPDLKPSPTKTRTNETEITTPHSHNHNDDYSPGHFHETVSPSAVVEPVSSGSEYDWRNDGVFDVYQQPENPLKPTYPGRELTEADDDTYPPHDWYKTEEPELRAKYFYAQLLKQFGDIPEVHVIGEHKLNIAKKAPIAIDQYIEYLEASQVLWPNEKNAELLEVLRRDKVERGK